MHSRKVFIETLLELAKNDDKIVLVVTDVGFSFIELFKEKFPDRYFNFGVTEQSTALIVTAMAKEGFKPWFYSMINFVAFRPYEMVRNGIALHNANVKLVGVKGSEKYKFLGFSHNMLYENEDVDVLKHLPNMSIYIPQDEKKVRESIIDAYKIDGPCYLRL